MKEKTCCFTGHRDITENEDILKEKIKVEIRKLINRGVIYFGCGGARGFDTIAAQAVLQLKEKYPYIKLILILPCNNHTKEWSEHDKIRYAMTEQGADKIKILSPYYHKGCMHIRNRYMIDNSSYCICYLRRRGGGTAYTVDYALSKNRNIVYL